MGEQDKLLDSEGTPLATREGAPTSDSGLTSAEAQRLLAEHGLNELTEVKVHPFLKFLSYFVGPIPFLMEAATLISFVLFVYESSIGARDADPATWVVLFVLLFVNGFMGWREEASAGDAIAALKASLAPNARVKRDGRFQELPSKNLVPGDLIILKGGDIVPADSKLHEGEPMEVDQSALTGESLPVTCFPGDVVYSGSIIKRGELHATVYATGANTFFGKAAALVSSVSSQGHLQKVLLKVAYALMFTGIVLVFILFIVLALVQKAYWASALVSCLVLLVASIPIAMQVVTTATMAVGARDLANSKAIVARLASIEELAGMTILCSDKTGTLTKNKLTLDTPTVFYGKEEDCIFSAALAAKWEGQDAIDFCLTNGVANQDFLYQHKQPHFIPFDPVIKRTEATIIPPSGEQFKVTKGAPQVIAGMAHNASEIAAQVDDIIEEFGQRGFRAIGVARTTDAGVWEFQGLIPLFDPPRDDTKQTIENALAMGVEVKMITGDHMTIAKETCRRLGMGTNIYTIDIMHQKKGEDQQGQMAENADGFAQVFPEHKFEIVEVLQKRGHLTGMTGDGVNDAPALKKADVGIAVEGATDAARAAADIVLTEPGLSVIIIAMVKAREIFLRMKAYVIYRIAATITLLTFMFVSQIMLHNKRKPYPETQKVWAGFPYPPDPSAFYANGPQPSWQFTDHNIANQNQLFYEHDDAKYPHFTLPAIVLVILTILNDGTILSIAYDRVVADKKPQQWRLARVLVICLILGLLGFAECMIGYYVLAIASSNTDGATPIELAFSASVGGIKQGTPRLPLTPGQIETCIYLILSIGGQAIVFAARTNGFFFTRRPGNLLLSAFLFAQTISLLLAFFWPFGGSLEPLAMNSYTTCLGVGPFISLANNPNIPLPSPAPTAPCTLNANGTLVSTFCVPTKGSANVNTGCSATNCPTTFFEVPLYMTDGGFGEILNGGNPVPSTVQFTNSFCARCYSYAENDGNGGVKSYDSTCFLHAVKNHWAVGFVIFWALVWFIIMDVSKVACYKYFESQQSAEERRIDRRKEQKRLSVAFESERRATLGGQTASSRAGAQPGSVQAAVKAQEAGNVPESLKRALSDLQGRMDGMEKEHKELRALLEGYLAKQ